MLVENIEEKTFKSAIDEVILLPRRALGYIGSASADELRVLIYICACSGTIDVKKAADELKMAKEVVETAIGYWRGTKIITLPDDNSNPSSEAEKKASSKVNTLQIYEPQLLAEKVGEDNRFKMLVEHVAQRFEKGTLNKNDLNSLYYLYDYINIPSELLCGIVEYCAENDKKSMNYLVRTAINLYEEQEINTYEKLEGYLNARRAYNDGISKFRRLAGIADRGLTAKEKATFAVWFEERVYPFEMIEYAYEITVDKLQKYNLNYVNAILERWFTEGITTFAGAKENVESYKEKHKKFDNDTYDFDDFFNAALNRK